MARHLTIWAHHAVAQLGGLSVLGLTIEVKRRKGKAGFWKEYIESNEVKRRELTEELLEHSLGSIMNTLDEVEKYSIFSIIDSYFSDLIEVSQQRGDESV